MRKTLNVFLMIMLVLIFTACTTLKKDNLAMKPTEPNCVFDEKSGIYTNQWVETIVNFSGSYNDLMEQHPTPYIQNSEQLYSIFYYSATNVAELTFDNAGNKLFHRLHNLNNSKEAFDSLKIGDTLDNVQSIDPSGDYAFLSTGRNDSPRVSTHYTTDRHIIKICYNTENQITDINIISFKTGDGLREPLA